MDLTHRNARPNLLTLRPGEITYETACRRIFAYPQGRGLWNVYGRSLDTDGSPIIGGRDTLLDGAGSLLEAQRVARVHSRTVLPNGIGVQEYAGYKGHTTHELPNGQTAVCTVIDGAASDLDTFAGRWQTVCELHGSVCSHATLREAKGAAASGCFCEDCEAIRTGEPLKPLGGVQPEVPDTATPETLESFLQRVGQVPGPARLIETDGRPELERSVISRIRGHGPGARLSFDTLAGDLLMDSQSAAERAALSRALLNLTRDGILSCPPNGNAYALIERVGSGS